jgi:nucleoside-diphosphate-sugar epimerase
MTCGQARGIHDLVEIVRKDFPHLEVEYVERDTLMPVRGTLSIEKARRLLGYAPEYSLERGMREYIDWYRSLDATAGQPSNA